MSFFTIGRDPYQGIGVPEDPLHRAHAHRGGQPAAQHTDSPAALAGVRKIVSRIAAPDSLDNESSMPAEVFAEYKPVNQLYRSMSLDLDRNRGTIGTRGFLRWGNQALSWLELRDDIKAQSLPWDEIQTRIRLYRKYALALGDELAAQPAGGKSAVSGEEPAAEAAGASQIGWKHFAYVGVGLGALWLFGRWWHGSDAGSAEE